MRDRTTTFRLRLPVAPSARGASCVVAVTLVALAACSDAPRPTDPGPSVTVPTPNVALTDTAGLSAQGLDVDVATAARAVPGFGGFFVDRGVPTVWLTDANQRPQAQRALEPLARAHGIDLSTLAVRRADYDIGRLGGWFAKLSPEVLALPGVVYTDLDESTNRLVVAVEPGVTSMGVLGAAARLGVPAAAVTFKQVGAIHPLVTLRDRIRPVRGGLQLSIAGLGTCTLGFNAFHGSERSFITNSHCTNQQGGVDGTNFSQNIGAGSTNIIGTEVEDPFYFPYPIYSACPAGRVCRMSDAARANYKASVGSLLGRIARTTGPNNGSLTIGNPSSFTITSEATGSSFVVGTPANKVGRTTGWTIGVVTGSCVHSNQAFSNITKLCQTYVAAKSGPGDSGSPVFQLLSGGTNVRLLGILWGGPSDGSYFVFSPMKNIEQDLGALRTF
jgi:hypothetical protein